MVFVEGLRTRALSGENAGSDTYAVARVDGGGRHDRIMTERTRLKEHEKNRIPR